MFILPARWSSHLHDEQAMLHSTVLGSPAAAFEAAAQAGVGYENCISDLARSVMQIGAEGWSIASWRSRSVANSPASIS